MSTCFSYVLNTNMLSALEEVRWKWDHRSALTLLTRMHDHFERVSHANMKWSVWSANCYVLINMFRSLISALRELPIMKWPVTSPRDGIVRRRSCSIGCIIRKQVIDFFVESKRGEKFRKRCNCLYTAWRITTAAQKKKKLKETGESLFKRSLQELCIYYFVME